MLKTRPELRSKLWDNVRALQSGLKKQNFDLGKTQSCVTPVFLKGDIHEAFVMVKELREKYFIFCSIVVYPVIPKGFILLRLIPTTSHNIDDVNETLSAFSKIRSKLNDGTYKKIAEKLKMN
jgi:glycine C-acetyltransferase